MIPSGTMVATLLKGGGGNPVLALLAKGTVGAWWAPTSGLIYTDNLGATPATANGDSIGLQLDQGQWGGKSFAAEAASQPELWTNPAPTIINFAGTVGAYNTSTKTFTNSGTAVAGYPRFQFGLGLTIGKIYYVSGTLTGSISKVASLRLAGSGQASNIAYNTSTGVFSGIAPAGAVFFEVGLDPAATWTGADSVVIQSITVKEIPGSPGSQASASLRPKLQAGPVLRPDAADDNLLTALAPGSSGYMGGRILGPASVSATQTIIGGTIGTSRCMLALNTSRQICAGIGTDSVSTIVGSNDLGGQTLCVWVAWNGTTVTLYENGRPVYSAAQNGSIGADTLRLFATNNGGVAGNYGGMDTYHLLAGKGYMPTAAEMAAVSAYLNSL